MSLETPEVIRTTRFVSDAAGFIEQHAELALKERGEFRLALSGGNTPRPVFEELARCNLPWDRVRITFGDERCVPPDDKQSNYRMAREALLSKAKVPDESVLRMRGEVAPAKAADEYQDQLDRMAEEKGETIYRHDLILLGMGDDGHTASLFPGTPALDETQRRVVANFVPKFDQWRITFTYRLINAARHVCFLANAAKNAELLQDVIGGNEQYPAARVRPADGRVTWILGVTE
ncbi:MAG: 6-phosphogluconolactonase [Chthoniobacterales bacterium]